MEIKEAKFLKSSVQIGQCPPTDLPEFAFIGRSNVGKSSLINMLTNNKNLAKTSGKPGKTRLINHFIVDARWYLVDLPGFGYAKVSKKERAKWERNTYLYLEKRENLQMIFLLIDSRIPPQKIDLEFMQWLASKQLPFVLLFTKCDKLKSDKVDDNLKAYVAELRKNWKEIPFALKTSSEDKTGREEILNLISGMI